VTSPESGHYEIRVEGNLDSFWATYFDGLHIEHCGADTVISGELRDQAALHGVLTTIRDVGLRLLSVERTDPDR
jgi:hypothetical protein